MPPPMSPPNGNGSLTTEIQSAISKGILNGAIILASDSTSSFTYSSALGTRTLLSGETVPQALNDVLYLASATKLLTSIAALQCVEDGLVSLTSDLSSIVPELTSKSVLKGWSNADSTPPVAILEPQLPENPPITLKSLLTHSSGMIYDFFDPTGIQKYNTTFNPLETSPNGTPIPRPVEKAFAYPLSFHPSKGWMYGPSVDWAGLIVERLTTRKLGDHIRERIIKPVNGNPSDAEFYPPGINNPDLRNRLIDLNPEDPLATGKQVLAGGGNMNLVAEGDFGGHGLFTTAENFLKVLKSLLANDGKLLKPGTVDLMFQDHLSGEAKKGHEEALKGPAGSFFAVGTDEFPGIKVGHGLGGLVTLDGVEGWYGKGTMTWGGGHTLVWFVDRENDLCGIGALQAKLPVVETAQIADVKQVFRRDIYRIREAWRANAEGGE